MVTTGKRTLLRGIAAVAAMLAFALSARADDPFVVTPRRIEEGGVQYLEVRFAVPPGHFLYADQIGFEAEGSELTPVQMPTPSLKEDPFTGEPTRMYAESFSTRHRIETPRDGPLGVTLRWQGCNDLVCFMPQRRRFELALGAAASAGADGASPPATALVEAETPSDRPAWQALLDKFEERGRAAGYLNVAEFSGFLDTATVEATAKPQPKPRGLWVTLLLTLIGGAALNLTPCVLPMIPVNLAIIGAGMKAGSKRRGLLLGAVYGGAMALAYGALGLVVVLTGRQFGTLNSLPWFNAAIAAIFFVLALGMFGVFNIDFTRFQPTAASGGRSGVALAFGMGAISALLAGACVAPVVISVVVLAGDWYLAGNAWGLALPFVLGIGMGLPWPFAGAGLAFLPKPGPWMNYVKYAFAVVILGFATYYAQLAWSARRSATALPAATATADAPALNEDAEGAALAEGLRRALAENKPVVVDFWATWCKNCLAMDRTTLKDEIIQSRLAGMVFVKYQAEHPSREPAKTVLDRFRVIGLPTYVLLTPRAAQ